MRLPAQALGTIIAGIILASSSGEAARAASCDWSSHRYVLAFYQYQGVISNDSQEQFSGFRSLINSEMIQASRELQALVAPQQITIKTEPDISTRLFRQGNLDPQLSQTIISRDPRVLALLDGALEKRSNGPSEVHSNIYLGLGRISSTEPADPIAEDFILDPDRYADAKNVHLAATYFALAVDAGSDPHSAACRDLERQLLDKTREILEDVTGGGAATQALAAGIAAEYHRLGAPP